MPIYKRVGRFIKDSLCQYKFEELEEACDFAEEKAKKVAIRDVIDAGAEDPYVNIVHKTEGSLQRYIARAVGNPKISHHVETMS